MKKYLLFYISFSTTNKTSKNILTVLHIIIHNGGNNGDMRNRLRHCNESFKTSLKNMKI